MEYEIVDRGNWDHNGTLRGVKVAAPYPVTRQRIESARRAAKRALPGARSSRHVHTQLRMNGPMAVLVFEFDVSRLESLR